MDEDYATRRIVSHIGKLVLIHERNLDAGFAMIMARNIWERGKEHGNPYDKVCVVNERTGCTTDTISRIGELV